MFDANTLSQLTQLKQDIRSDKNLIAGTVRGSQGRYGFVNLDDGREIFLPPEEMSRVLPGDRVEISVAEKTDATEERKLQGSLDKLLSSIQKNVVGQYIVRGKGHFVSVDMPQLKRWVFLPPKARGKAKEGDYLLCRLIRHPFEDSKPQAKVTEVLGKPEDNGIEHKVTCYQHGLKTSWGKNHLQQVDAIKQLSLEQLPDFDSRHKLQEQLFVTIDSAATQDMDDALSIETHESGWKLSVAIADPSSSLAENSPLDRVAQARANTAYLPGKAISMLPQELSHRVYSLVPGEDRPALLCHLIINAEGEIESSQFEFGVIRSHHKLTYVGVAEFLETGHSDSIDSGCHKLLQTLAACSKALNQYRRRHMLLMEERDDYYLQLNERGHIADIRREGRNQAQQIVEEAMLATNRSAGELFAQHTNSGIFSTHLGFRPERLENIQAVIKADFPELAELDLTSLAGYRSLMQQLQESPHGETQLAALRLMLQAGVVSQEALPHMGLGMQHYATVTSPIRRYQDLFNHRALKAIVQQKQSTTLDTDQLQALQKSINTARQASRDLEQWLHCLFMQKHKDETFSARVTRVTSQGISVQLLNWGIVGFAKLNPKAFKFDPDRMTMTKEDQRFALNQTVTVKLDRVDMDKKRINFTLQAELEDSDSQAN